MSKKRFAKKALLTSALSLLLCLSMLIGTTFAWFTDTVVSAGNIIKSGNLDVEMYWADGAQAVPTEDTGWTDASTGAIFTYDLWEPGYVQVRHIKIANVGSLAMKYKVNIIANGPVTDLTDVIDVYYMDPAVQVADRADLVAEAKLGTLTQVLANLASTGNGTLAANTADTITIAFKMQETAGNTYQDKSIGADFSVQVLATQFTAETDSFDDQYDQGSEYVTMVNNALELKAAVAEGGNVALNADITLAEGDVVEVPEGKTAVLNLNGKTLAGGYQTGSTEKHVYTIANRGTLTLTGDGVVTGRGVSNYGTLTVNDGTYMAIDTNGGGCIWNYAGSVTINGGKFEAAEDTNAPGPTCINIAAGSEVTINGGTFLGKANQTAAIINSGNLTIKNANVVSDHITLSNTATAVVDGGNFELVGVANQTSNMFYMTSGVTTINGGNFVYDRNNVLDSGHLLTFAGGEVVVNGGNFEGYVTTQLDNYGYSNGKATVNGGTFDQEPAAKWLGANRIVTEVGGKFVVSKDANVGPTVNVTVKTAAELQAALSPAVSDGKAVVSLDADIELAAGETWTTLNMDPYTGVNQIEINGNGHTIKGLNAPLLGDIHFGGTKVAIKNLTLADCKIENQCYNAGLGAFVAYADNCDLITLENCHLKDSTLSASAGTGVGGLVGYSSSDLVLTGCSVTNCTITGASQSAGAIAGHVSAGGAVTSITDAKVVGCTVTGQRENKTGYVLGTANDGTTTVTTNGCSGNTVLGTADSTKVYGRLVGGSLTVNGETMPQD